MFWLILPKAAVPFQEHVTFAFDIPKIKDWCNFWFTLKHYWCKVVSVSNDRDELISSKKMIPIISCFIN